MLKLIKKRKFKFGVANGNIDDMLPIIIFIMAMAIMLHSFINYNIAVNQKTTLNSVARSCLLKMETKGYMTEDIYQSIHDTLYDLGYRGTATGGSISQSNFQGTTTSDVGYGNDICLTFTVYTTNTMLSKNITNDDGSESIDILSPQFQTDYVPITITYYSTSKE